MHTSRRIGFTATCVLLCMGIAQASTLLGPVYPPPGGASFIQTGTGAGDAGGITWTLSALQVNNFNLLYWGPADANGVQVTLDAGVMASLSYSSVDSSLPSVARWTGLCHYVHPILGDQGNIPVRFTLTQLGTGELMAAPSQISSSGVVVDVIPGGSSFQVNFLYEAFFGGVWLPVNDLLQVAACTNCVQTSFNGGFFYEECTAPMGEIALATRPATVQTGDLITFRTCGGTPGHLAFLFLTGVNGFPNTIKLIPGSFDGNGLRILAGNVPNVPSLPGNTLTFATFAIGSSGFIVQTNGWDVVFQ